MVKILLLQAETSGKEGRYASRLHYSGSLCGCGRSGRIPLGAWRRRCRLQRQFVRHGQCVGRKIDLAFFAALCGFLQGLEQQAHGVLPLGSMIGRKRRKNRSSSLSSEGLLIMVGLIKMMSSVLDTASSRKLNTSPAGNGSLPRPGT